MPDTGLLALSIVSVGTGALLVLSPKSLLSTSQFLNQTVVRLDEFLIRSRYVWGMLLALAGYGLFRLALVVPGSF